MKEFFKYSIPFIIVSALVGAYFLGFHIARNKYETKITPDTASYVTYGNVKNTLVSSYESLYDEDLTIDSDGTEKIEASQKIAKVSESENKVVVSKAPQTNVDVFTEKNGSVLELEGGYSLNLKAVVKNPIKMVMKLIYDGKLELFNQDYAVTYQIRDAQTAPSDFDVKIKITVNVGSLTINTLVSDQDGVISNDICVFIYNQNFEVDGCIYADKDVYVSYDIESDKSYILDSTKQAYNTYRAQVDEELEKFEKLRSIIDTETDFTKYITW